MNKQKVTSKKEIGKFSSFQVFDPFTEIKNLERFFQDLSYLEPLLKIESLWVPLFYYSTVQSHLRLSVCVCVCVCVPCVSLELAMQDSHPNLYCTKTSYHLYISINVDCFI